MVAEVHKLQKVTSELQQDKAELEEQNEHKNSANIQGLPEPSGQNVEDKTRNETDKVTE